MGAGGLEGSMFVAWGGIWPIAGCFFVVVVVVVFFAGHLPVP